jgi:O-acetyl-ADP-ribose deacetylase (regulator of RNase III)
MDFWKGIINSKIDVTKEKEMESKEEFVDIIDEAKFPDDKKHYYSYNKDPEKYASFSIPDNSIYYYPPGTDDADKYVIRSEGMSRTNTYCTYPEGIEIKHTDDFTKAMLQTIINLPLFFNDIKVDVAFQDLFTVNTESIVIAGNAQMGGGSGVSGFLYANEDADFLKKEVKTIRDEKGNEGDLSLEEIDGKARKGARTTPSKKLKSRGIKYIIHAIGPDLRSTTDSLEKSCRKLFLAYNSVFDEMLNIPTRSVSIPYLSTGIFKFPPALGRFIANYHILSRVLNKGYEYLKMVIFSEYDTNGYSEQRSFISEMIFRMMYRYMLYEKYHDSLFKKLYILSIPNPLFYNVTKTKIDPTSDITIKHLSKICHTEYKIIKGDHFDMLKKFGIINGNETCDGFYKKTCENPDVSSHKYKNVSDLIVKLNKTADFAKSYDSYDIAIHKKEDFEKFTNTNSKYLILSIIYVPDDGLPIILGSMILTNIIDNKHKCYNLLWEGRFISSKKYTATFISADDPLKKVIFNDVIKSSLYLVYTQKNVVMDASLLSQH